MCARRSAELHQHLNDNFKSVSLFLYALASGQAIECVCPKCFFNLKNCYTIG